MTCPARKEKPGLISRLALAACDEAWLRTLSGSTAGTLWSWFSRRGRRISSAPVQRFACWLELISFLVVLALAMALGMRQFANDREGLALFVLAAAGLRLAGAWLGGKEVYRATAIDGVVLAYFGANVVATFASHYLLASMTGLAKLAVFVTGYFLFVAVLGQSRRRMVAVIACLVLSGLAVALYGLYQYKIGVAPLATWEDPSVEMQGTRIYSTLGNPNLLAGYLVPLVPLSFALAMVAAWGKRLYLCLPLLGITGVLALAVVLTGSRGGYIGLIGAASGLAMIAGNWLWREQPRTRLWILIGLCALPVFAWLAVHFVPAVEQRFMSIFAGGEHTSNRYRLNVWLSSLQMFKDNWWFGVGPGNKAFRLAYGLYMISSFDALGTYCVPLEVAVEAGVAGLASFAALVVGLLARAHLNFYATADGGLRWLIAGLAAALVGLMAHGLVDTVFYRPQVQFIFWIAAALIVTAGPSAAQPSSGD